MGKSGKMTPIPEPIRNLEKIAVCACNKPAGKDDKIDEKCVAVDVFDE